MLSGLAPFYSRPRLDTANSIMRRIKEGDFRMDGEAWRCVSAQAKNLCKGLLTVDHRKRISVEQLASSTWIQQHTGSTGRLAAIHHNNCPTLMTSTLLLSDPSTEQCIKQTYDAFHNATRDGFRLIPLASNNTSKLLQKRKLKQSTSTETISSTSDRSSLGSKSSSSSGSNLASASAKLWSSAVHGGATNNTSSSSASNTPSSKLKDGEVFSFKPGQVTDYLSSFRSAAGSSLGSGLSVTTTPLNLPLSINVSSYSSHIMSVAPPPSLLSYPPLGGAVVAHQQPPPPYDHHPHSSHSRQFIPTTTTQHQQQQLKLPLSNIMTGPHSLPNSAVSLSIISPPVINSAATTPSPNHTAAGGASNRLHCPPQCSSCTGPVTRSRKRKLCEMDNAVTAAIDAGRHNLVSNAATLIAMGPGSGGFPLQHTQQQLAASAASGAATTYTADITLATTKNFLEPLNFLQQFQHTPQQHTQSKQKCVRQGTITIE